MKPLGRTAPAGPTPRTTGAALAHYLNGILVADDPALLAAALGELARQHGMREVARAAGISREALYKALRPGADPRFATIHRVCRALGVKLVAMPSRRGQWLKRSLPVSD